MSTKDYVEKDYYAALGVAKDADAPAIKKAYRKLARELHPDKNPGDAQRRGAVQGGLRGLRRALRPAKRKEYDEARSLFGSGGGGSARRLPPGGGYAGGGVRRFDMSDLFGARSAGGGLGDLFSDLFGGGRPATARRASGGPAPVKGQDVRRRDHARLRRGGARRRPCRCSCPVRRPAAPAGGTAPGPAPRRARCPTCGGAGIVTVNQGGFGFQRAVPRLPRHRPDHRRPVPGVRRHRDRPCRPARSPSACRPGSGTAPGCASPARARRARAAARPATCSSRCTSRAHPLFGRSGDDLTLTVPITFAEAALGTTLRVPTLDGAVSLKVAPGTPSGRTLRVRGRGVPAKSGTGDLLVTVEVAVPAEAVRRGARGTREVRRGAGRRSASADHGGARRAGGDRMPRRDRTCPRTHRCS